MKKVLFISDSEYFGGAESYMFDLAQESKKYDFDILILFTNAIDKDYLGELSEKLNVQLVFFKESIKSKTEYLFELKSILNKCNPDIIHVNLASPLKSFYLLVFLKMLRKKIVITFHLVTEKFYLSKKRKMVYNFLFKNVKIISVSQNNAKILKQKFSINNVKVVPNGVTINLPTLNESNFKFNFLNSIKVMNPKDDIKIAIIPARISSQKDHKTLIEAINLLKSSTNYIFICAGDYDAEKEIYDDLINLVNQYNLSELIYFIGHFKEYKKLLLISDLVILPTHYEGQPFALLEAMAAKKPIIVSDVSGISEIISDKYNGILVKENDIEHLANEINFMEKNQDFSVKLSLNAYEYSKKYSLESMCNETFNLYNEV